MIKGLKERCARHVYLAVMSRFHRYSRGNVLLIYSQRPQATHVAGFHAWLRMRRYVRKGEKGIVILAPMVGRRKSDRPDDELVEDEQTRAALRARGPPLDCGNLTPTLLCAEHMNRSQQSIGHQIRSGPTLDSGTIRNRNRIAAGERIIKPNGDRTP